MGESRKKPPDTTEHLIAPRDTSADAAASPVLKLLSGPEAGRVIRLTPPEMQLGRGTENDLVLNESGVSRRHCKLVVESNRVMLVDLGSTNGTFVGGRRIASEVLEEGTLIMLGTTARMRFLMLEPDEKELEVALFDEATRDPLTRALNRRSWLKQVSGTRARYPHHNYAVALADLDRFKSINDISGHLAGDAVLIEFCRRSRGLGRDVLMGRWGGEELVFFLPGMTLAQAVRRMNRLREDVAGVPFEVKGSTPINVTVSIGVVTGGPETIDDLVAAADKELYRAKNEGRDRVCAPGPPPAPAPGAAGVLSQRRRKSRATCRVAVWCQLDDDSFAAQVTDLSTGGLCLLTDRRIDNGATLEVRLQSDPSRSVTLRATFRGANASGRSYGGGFTCSPDELRGSWVGEALKSQGITAESARERRAEVRVAAPANVLLHGPMGSYTLRLVNFGSGGCCVTGPLIPSVAQRLTFELSNLKVEAEVIWSRAPRCGLRWGALLPQQRVALETLFQQALASHRRASGSTDQR